MKKITSIIIAIFLSLMLHTIAEAKHRHHEKYYQQKWCDDQFGVTEYRLPDSTRVDCLTYDYAVEFDFGNKWAESIGQALYYGIRSGHVAGIVLILEKKSDIKYWNRLQRVVYHLSKKNVIIRTWKLEAWK